IVATALLSYLGGWLLLIALSLVAWRFGLSALEFGHRGASTLVIYMPIAPFQWAITGFIALAAALQMIVLIKDGVILLIQYRQWRDQACPRNPDRIKIVLPLALGVLVVGFIGAAALNSDWSLVWLLPQSPLLIALLFFLLMWVAGLLLFPLWAVMLLIGFTGLGVILDTGPARNLIATRTFDLRASDVLLIIPLFMLMGTFAQTAGLSTDIFRLANALLGHLRGGLALATIGACAGFGAMTGSSIATALTIGQAAYPEMRRFGYSESLSTGSIAAGGTLGQLVPPSAVMVLYAILTETSVGTLFIAAAIPAALIILFFILAVMAQVRLNPNSAPKAAIR
ncbi:MAG: TRAP transporter large permease subunit, partial [Rhodospirillales bacterium]|nr:TRAP transporter large permease subunit [Rhodospirillales bacterium]